jgi:hypothetical protein
MEPVTDFTLLHTNGLHTIHVRFCGCPEAPSWHVQLLCTRWWASTATYPQTAATVDLLAVFCAVNLHARANATDYYCSLERLTDDSIRASIPVSFHCNGIACRHLRIFSWCTGPVTQVSSHGVCMACGTAFLEGGRFMFLNGRHTTPPGGIALPCRACPQPGINMPKDWHTSVKKP